MSRYVTYIFTVELTLLLRWQSFRRLGLIQVSFDTDIRRGFIIQSTTKAQRHIIQSTRVGFSYSWIIVLKCQFNLKHTLLWLQTLRELMRMYTNRTIIPVVIFLVILFNHFPPKEGNKATKTYGGYWVVCGKTYLSRENNKTTVIKMTKDNHWYYI